MRHPLLLYKTLLKKTLQHPSTYILIFCMCLLSFLLTKVLLPEDNSVSIGFCSAASNYSEDLLKELKKNADITLLSFQPYESAEDLIHDVTAGQLDCGFLLSEQFDEIIASGRSSSCVTVFEHSGSTYSEIAKETVYSAILSVSRDALLEDFCRDIFTDATPLMIDEVIRESHRIQDSDQVFQINMVNYVSESNHPEGEKKHAKDMLPGILGTFLFLAMFLSAGEWLSDDRSRIFSIQTKKEQFLFRFLHLTAFGTIPCAVIYLILLLTGTMISHSPITELFLLIGLVLLNSLWILLVGSLPQKKPSFFAAVLTLTLLHLLLCPVLVDLSRVISSLRFLRFLFPLGLYLSL